MASVKQQMLKLASDLNIMVTFDYAEEDARWLSQISLDMPDGKMTKDRELTLYLVREYETTTDFYKFIIEVLKQIKNNGLVDVDDFISFNN